MRKFLSRRKITAGILLTAAAVVRAVLGADYATKDPYRPYIPPDQLSSHLRDITNDQIEKSQQQIDSRYEVTASVSQRPVGSKVAYG